MRARRHEQGGEAQPDSERDTAGCGTRSRPRRTGRRRLSRGPPHRLDRRGRTEGRRRGGEETGGIAVAVGAEARAEAEDTGSSHGGQRLTPADVVAGGDEDLAQALVGGAGLGALDAHGDGPSHLTGERHAAGAGRTHGPPRWGGEGEATPLVALVGPCGVERERCDHRPVDRPQPARAPRHRRRERREEGGEDGGAGHAGQCPRRRGSRPRGAQSCCGSCTVAQQRHGVPAPRRSK